MATDFRQDTQGRIPPYQPGDRVWVNLFVGEATVLGQQLHWDGEKSFWGTVLLQYDDGCTGSSMDWQLARVIR